MKRTKFWSLMAFCLCLAGTSVMTACGDDDDDQPKGGDTSVKASDLVGTWTLDDVTYVFTKDNLTISYSGDQSFNGKYTYDNGRISYTTSYDGQEYTTNAEVKLLYNKTVLVVKELTDWGDGNTGTEMAQVLYKSGKKPTTSSKDIQGTWHMYMHGDPNYIRVGVKIEGNKIEIIITPWAERHVGTFTYEGGILKLNMTEFYSARGEHGEGWGEGDLNPATLECSHWFTCSYEDIGDHIDKEMVFIADGKEAYGSIVGMPAIYVKK